MAKEYEPLDTQKLRTSPLARRQSKVHLAHVGRVWEPGGRLDAFLKIFPEVLAGRDLGERVVAIVAAPGTPAQDLAE